MFPDHDFHDPVHRVCAIDRLPQLWNPDGLDLDP